MTDLYVATNGADTAAGTLSNPWRTFGHALPRLKPGDSLYVRGGVYTESIKRTFQVATADRRIIWQAYPGERVVIKGQQSFVRPSFWTISNLEFTVNGPSTDHSVKIHGGAGWVLDGVEIYGNTVHSGLLIGKSSVHGAPRDWVLRNSFIHDTALSNAYVAPSRENVNGLIERNVFWNAKGSASSNVKLGWGGVNVVEGYNGIMLGAAGITFRYNTLHSAAQPLTIAEATAGEIKVYRNIITTGRRATSSRMLVRLDSVEGHLGGSIAVYDNLGYDATMFISDLNGRGPVRVADADKGGNVFPRNPLFNHTNDRSGFRPADSIAAQYGITAVTTGQP